MVGLAMDQPLEGIFFPGILDGLTGRLSLTSPGVVDPPTSARAGMSQRWAAALREAVMRNEGRDIDLGQVTPLVVHPGLHQDYDLDFRTRRVDGIAPTLTSPLLSGLFSNIRLLGRPEVPREPVSSKAEEDLWGHNGTPARPDVPGPSHSGGLVPHMRTAEVEAKENKPREQGGIYLDQTLPGPDPEDVAAVVISDDDETDLPIDMPQAASTPKVEPAWNQKRPLEDRCPHSSPPKKWATEEEERRTPLREAVLPRGVAEEDIFPKRYETFTSDNNWVQHVRCSLLGLEAGTMPSRKDIDTSDRFVPRAVVSESDLPEVITDHWLPILRSRRPPCGVSPGPVHCYGGLGLFVHSRRFAEISSSSTMLLYEPRHTKLDSSCAPEFCVGTDKEFLLSNFH